MDPLERLLLGAQAWNTWRTEHPSWRPRLRGAQLPRTQLEGFDLSGADLRGANLEGAFLTEACLDRAWLQSARLAGSQMGYASVREANLSGVSLQGAALRGTDFQGSLLLQAGLEEADLSLANFRLANLCQARLVQARLYATCFEHAFLEGCRLTEELLLESPPLQFVLEGIDVLILEDHILLDHQWSFLQRQVFSLTSWLAALEEGSSSASAKTVNQAVPGWWEHWAELILVAAAAGGRTVPGWQHRSAGSIQGSDLLRLAWLCLTNHWKMEEELQRLKEQQPLDPIDFIKTWHYLEDSAQGLR